MTDFSADKSRLDSDVNALQRDATQQQLFSPVESAGAKLRELAQKLQTYRGAGYIFARELDDQIAILTQGWSKLEADIMDMAQSRARKLNWDITDLHELCSRILPSDPGAQAQISRAAGEVTRLRNAIRDTQQQIRMALGQIPDQLNAIGEAIERIQKTIEHAQGASFPFKDGESLYLAAKAGWKKGEKETIDGVLYITDQRLVMEQDQKKGGFMGMGGNRIREFAWEAPISGVQDVGSEKKGLLGHIDLIHLRFGTGGPGGDATVEVKDGYKADWFATQIQRARSGGLESDKRQPGQTPGMAATAMPGMPSAPAGFATAPTAQGPLSVPWLMATPAVIYFNGRELRFSANGSCVLAVANAGLFAQKVSNPGAFSEQAKSLIVPCVLDSLPAYTTGKSNPGELQTGAPALAALVRPRLDSKLSEFGLGVQQFTVDSIQLVG